MKNVAVYTATFDDYDNVAPPPVPSGADFHCFTNSRSRIASGWIIHDHQKSHATGKLSSLALKTRIPDALRSYSFVLWIDGNIRLHADPASFVPQWLGPHSIAAFLHPGGGGLEQELARILEFRPADYERSKEQLEGYARDDEAVRSLPVFATGVLARKNSDPKVHELGEAWWREISGRDAPRDQMSFPIVLKRLSFEIVAIRDNIYMNHYLCVGPHA